MKLKKVEVMWLDHSSVVGWVASSEDTTPVQCHSVGWVVKETTAYLTISTTINSSGDFADPLTILKKLITRRRYI